MWSANALRRKLVFVPPLRRARVCAPTTLVRSGIMRQPALALCVCVSLCVSRAALLPVASLRSRLPQCRARAGVIRGAAPDNVLTDEDALAAQRRVWALIFNYRSENEGIYTQQRGDGREYVLTWQAEEDATRCMPHRARTLD